MTRKLLADVGKILTQNPNHYSDFDAIKKKILAELATVNDPELRIPLMKLNMIGNIELKDINGTKTINVDIFLTVARCPAADKIKQDVADALYKAIGNAPHTITMRTMNAQQRQALRDTLKGRRSANKTHVGLYAQNLQQQDETIQIRAKNVIAITSGKGGVGKSTLTANLSFALASFGLKIAVVDADVYGFCIPDFFGIKKGDGPVRIDGLMVPPVVDGISIISIGMFLRTQDEVVAWRGPMIHRTIKGFLQDAYFGNIDIMLIDMPPGTGDAAISLAQMLPGSMCIVTTTPQSSAAKVAFRAGFLAQKTGMRPIGVVEMLSGQVGALDDALFGSGGGTWVANRLSVPLLGSVPISLKLRQAGDRFTILTKDNPKDPAAKEIFKIAKNIMQIAN